MQTNGMRKIWHRYVRTGFGTQIGVSILLVFVITTLFVALLMFSRANPEATLASVLGDLLFDNPGGDVSKTSKSVYQLLLLIILAVWQAVFLARLLTRPHDFRFSKSMALYPYNQLKGRGSAPILVFRLLNDGVSDLYNVEIDATLVVYNPVHRVVQHFRCKVINNRIPVFRRQMPFWIAIETGEVLIKWGEDSLPLDRCFLFRVNRKDADGVRLINREYVEAVAENAQISPDIFSISVYVHGHDIDLDQEKAASSEYCIAQVQNGFFESIEPKHNGDKSHVGKFEFFDRDEIKSKFDRIVAQDGDL